MHCGSRTHRDRVGCPDPKTWSGGSRRPPQSRRRRWSLGRPPTVPGHLSLRLVQGQRVVDIQEPTWCSESTEGPFHLEEYPNSKLRMSSITGIVSRTGGIRGSVYTRGGPLPLRDKKLLTWTRRGTTRTGRNPPRGETRGSLVTWCFFVTSLGRYRYVLER